jgi:hypothetical protein
MGNVVKLRIRERQAAEASAKMRTLSERIEHDRAIRDAKDDFAKALNHAFDIAFRRGLDFHDVQSVHSFSLASACLRHKVRIPEEACEI